MNKRILFLFLFFILSYFSYAQCNQFDSLVLAADKLSTQGDFEGAVKKYTAAMVVCPERSKEAGDKIVLVFARIEALKQGAEKNEQGIKEQFAISKSLEIAGKAKDLLKATQYEEAMTLLFAAYDTAAADNAEVPVSIQTDIGNIYYGNAPIQTIKYSNLYGQVSAACLSPNGQLVLTGYTNGDIILWNIHGTPLKLMTREGSVSSLAFSPDAKSFVASYGGEHSMAVLWNLEGEVLQHFYQQYMTVSKALFAPNGKSVFIGYYWQHKAIKLNIGVSSVVQWGLQGKKLLEFKGPIEGVTSLDISPDGNQICAGGRRLVTLWDINGRIKNQFEAHNSDITTIAFSSDGNNILTGSYYPSASSRKYLYPDLIKREYIKIGKEVRAKYNEIKAIRGSEYMRETIKIRDYKAQARQDAEAGMITPHSAIEEQLQKIWFNDKTEPESDAVLWDLEGNKILSFGGYSKGPNSAIFSPNGKNIITGGEEGIKIWDINGKELDFIKNESSNLHIVAYQPKEKGFLAFDPTTGGLLWELDRGQKPIANIASERKMNLKKGYDFYILQNAAGDSIAKFENTYTASVSPDGQYILTGGKKGSQVVLWDLNGNKVRSFKGHNENSGVYSLAFSPDGQYVAAGARDSTVILWDLKGKLLQRIKQPKALLGEISFSEDSKYIFINNWLHDGDAYRVYPSSLTLWDLKGRLVQEFKGHEGAITATAISPDSKSLLASDVFGTIHRWPIDGSNSHQTIEGKYGDIKAIVHDQKTNSIMLFYKDYAAVYSSNWELLLKVKPKLDRYGSTGFDPVKDADGDIIAISYTDKGSKYFFYTISGIRKHSKIHISPEQLTSIGFNVPEKPSDQDYSAWVLWDYAKYWETKNNYEYALSFYKKYLSLANFPIVHYKLRTVSKRLKQEYSADFSQKSTNADIAYYAKLVSRDYRYAAEAYGLYQKLNKETLDCSTLIRMNELSNQLDKGDIAFQYFLSLQSEVDLRKAIEFFRREGLAARKKSEEEKAKAYFNKSLELCQKAQKQGIDVNVDLLRIYSYTSEDDKIRSLLKQLDFADLKRMNIHVRYISSFQEKPWITDLATYLLEKLKTQQTGNGLMLDDCKDLFRLYGFIEEASLEDSTLLQQKRLELMDIAYKQALNTAKEGGNAYQMVSEARWLQDSYNQIAIDKHGGEYGSKTLEIIYTILMAINIDNTAIDSVHENMKEKLDTIATSYQNMHVLLLEQKKHKNALNTSTQALALAAKFASLGLNSFDKNQLLLNHAHINLFIGNYNATKEYAEKSIQLEDTDKGRIYALIAKLMTEGYKDAKSLYEQSMAKNYTARRECLSLLRSLDEAKSIPDDLLKDASKFERYLDDI